MTVAELIEKLQALPQDLPVHVYDDWIDVPLNWIGVIGAITIDVHLSLPDRVVLSGQGAV